MNYFLDTEFLEGTQNTIFSKTKPTIDLISIALVDENGREYYAISKDFNLKAAWYRWEQRTGQGDRNNSEPKHYWIRENVLYPLFLDLINLQSKLIKGIKDLSEGYKYCSPYGFSFDNLKNLLSIHGKPNSIIANDICAFIYGDDCGGSGMSAIEMASKYEINNKSKNPVFYGYYCDYDWVVFCWLFGTMNKLPKGFPMYCRDLKQIIDNKAQFIIDYYKTFEFEEMPSFEKALEFIKENKKYPEQVNSHNALSDANWNKSLFNYLKSLNYQS